MATKPFAPMLAASEIPEPGDITFPTFASIKYDGIRATIHEKGRVMSRKMLELPNRAIQNWGYQWRDHLVGLDGEFIFGPPNKATTFNLSTSGCNNAMGGNGFTFYAFDIWNVAFDADDRYSLLCDRIGSMPAELRKQIVLVNQMRIGTWCLLEQIYNEKLDDGYEGLILKNPKGRYKNGRSTLKEQTLLKLKMFDTSEARILSVKQKQKNNNEQKRDELGYAKRSSAKAGQELVNAVGGFLVEDIDPKSVHYKKKFTVGPGCLTHEELESLWNEHNGMGGLPYDSLNGKVLTYKFQRPPKGNMDLPRFPGFKGWPNLNDTAV